jgi:hypothetical protein
LDRKQIPGIVWTLLVGSVWLPWCGAQSVRVTNFSEGETIRYSVPLIRGELSDPAALSVQLTNQTSLRTETHSIRGAAFGGKFVVLADLVPGPNRLIIRCGEAETRLNLTYRPQTNPYIVRAIYATDESGDTRYQSPIENDPQNYREKIGSALLLLQSIWADAMQENGYGRRTFNLELDGEGRVIVHTVRGDRSRDAYHQLADLDWYDRVYRLVERDYPMDRARNIVVAAYTEYKPDQNRVFSHTALGGGGLALFGGGVSTRGPMGFPMRCGLFPTRHGWMPRASMTTAAGGERTGPRLQPPSERWDTNWDTPSTCPTRQTHGG